MVIKKVVKIVELQKISSDNWTLGSWIQGVLAPLESSDSFIFGMCLLIQNLKTHWFRIVLTIASYWVTMA